MKQNGKTISFGRRWPAFIIIVIALALFAGLFIPWNMGELSSHPQLVQNYVEAVQRPEHIDATRTATMSPMCTSQFMTHGQKVRHVIILVHGYTSCPAQFVQLGQQFYKLGYNVLIVPLPHHG